MAYARVVDRYTIRFPAGRLARFDVPERTFRFPARSRSAALYDATLTLAHEVGIGPWRPWLHELASRAEVTVDRVAVQV
jgi:hypothetical protein